MARLLETLRVERIRSRLWHSNDNGPAETRNGAVVREVFGDAQSPQRWAAAAAPCAASR